MSRVKPYVAIGDGDVCPKCTNPMQRREHKELKEKQKNAPYYFEMWDYCRPCRHVQHHEEFKVYNKNQKK